jgi:hypothetical protein
VNSYKGVDFGTYANELHHIRNLYGCVLKTGVYIDKCTDIGRVENVHFNHHYWTRAVNVDQKFFAPLFPYSYLHTTAFEIGRADWEMFVDTFTISCKIGYHFIVSPDGACNGSFVGMAADYTQIPVLVDQTQSPGLLITNGQFVAGDATHDECMIHIMPTNTGVIQFNNCSFWGPTRRIADVAGDGMVSFTGCNFVRFPYEPKTGPAIVQTGGSLSVQGCYFHRNWDEIVIEKGAKSAVLVGNTSSDPIKLTNRSTADVQSVANVVRTMQPQTAAHPQ